MFDLKNYLDECVERFEKPDFIADDPIGIPHRFTKQEDIEIMAFWSSMLAWGQRKTIINSANRLVELMDGTPHDFILNHKERDRAPFGGTAMWVRAAVGEKAFQLDKRLHGRC